MCFVAHDLTGEISLLISVSAATEEPGPERDGEHGQRLRLTGEATTRTCVAGLKGGGGGETLGVAVSEQGIWWVKRRKGSSKKKRARRANKDKRSMFNRQALFIPMG